MKFSRLLVLVLCLALTLSPLARGEGRVTFAYGQKQDISVAWQEDWFAKDARVYRHGLCRLSLAMALSAFRGQAPQPDGDIRRFLEALGFGHIQTEQYNVTGPDTIGTALAFRQITTPEGAFPLVAIAVSGGNYGQEWLSNFDVGEEALHRGFAQAAQEAVARAAEYVRVRGLENPRFWVSGYSRGAAVSNVTAHLLETQQLAPAEHIFAYTFATPRTVRVEEAAAHPNIFNIINLADPVPQVPLEAWGYGWFGRTLALPSSLFSGEDYPALVAAYLPCYEALTGQTGEGDQVYAPLTQAVLKGLSLSAPTPQVYAQRYQEILGRVFTGQELTGAQQVLLGTVVMNLCSAAFKDSVTAISLLGRPDAALESAQRLLPVAYQHMPEIYLAWLLSIEEENAAQKMGEVAGVGLTK